MTNTSLNDWMRLLRAGLLLAAALTLILLAACGDDDDDNNGDSSPTATEANGDDDERTPSSSAESTTEPAVELPDECGIGEGGQRGLLSDLEFDREDRQYAPGEEVEMTLRLINCGENEARLHFVSGQRYEFIVANSETGDEVWRWSTDQAFSQETGEEVIENGEIVEYTEVWDQNDADGQPVPTGRYKVSGFSVGCGQPAEQACQFGPIRQIDIGTETEEATAAPEAS